MPPVPLAGDQLLSVDLASSNLVVPTPFTLENGSKLPFFFYRRDQPDVSGSPRGVMYEAKRVSLARLIEVSPFNIFLVLFLLSLRPSGERKLRRSPLVAWL